MNILEVLSTECILKVSTLFNPKLIPILAFDFFQNRIKHIFVIVMVGVKDQDMCNV